MKSFLIFFFGICFLCACKQNTSTKVDVSHIKAPVSIDRFDIDFYNSDEKTLSKTKEKYPMLFPNQPDSVWINKINNRDERELFAETQKEFKNVNGLETELENLFKHVRYYNANFKIPRVISVLTNIDYDNRVIVADSLLVISLDAYLGEKHPFYNDYPQYIKQNNTKEHIIVDVANEIINKQVSKNNNRMFLDKMIAAGKKMYVLDLYVPEVSDSKKIGYSEDKFQWALNSEEEVWKYFIERDLLYSTD